MKIIFQKADEDVKVVILPSGDEKMDPIGEDRLRTIIVESGDLAFKFLNNNPEIREISFSTQLSDTPEQEEDSAMMNTLMQLMNPKEN